MFCAMGAAEHHAAGRLDAVANDSTAAVGAGRGQGMYGTLEAVEGVSPVALHNLEGFVIRVTTNITRAYHCILYLLDLRALIISRWVAGREGFPAGLIDHVPIADGTLEPPILLLASLLSTQ